jgi:hypothetical protein
MIPILFLSGKERKSCMFLFVNALLLIDFASFGRTLVALTSCLFSNSISDGAY